MAAKRDVVVDQLDMDVVDQAPVTRFDDGCFNLLVVQACVADGTCRVVQMPAWSRETGRQRLARIPT